MRPAERKWWIFPIRISRPKFMKRVFPKYGAYSFLVWQIYKSQKALDWDELVNHENMHFRHHISVGFIFFIPIYYGHYYYLRLAGHSKKRAYHNIIFEKEAMEHWKDFDYIEKSGMYGWINNRKSINS